MLNAEVFNVYVDQNKHWLWTLTAEGITKIKLEDQEATVSPLVSITVIRVLGKPDTNSYNKPLVQYNSAQNSIGFTFAGASFIDEKKFVINTRSKALIKTGVTR
ncbi:MAG: hypothetical protein C4330_00185 [Chitinophagaceae bacterium]